MDKNAKFWDKAANKYSKQPITDVESYEHKLEKTRAHFSSQTRALEIGCGTGSTALLHAPHVKEYLATDLSSEMIEIAKSKLHKENIDNVAFQKSAISDLQISEPFDVVLALSVLHLVSDRDDTIRKVHEWLKPGGVFITSTVCLGDNMKFFKLIAPIAKFFGVFPLLRIFTANQLRKSLTDNGFEIDYDWHPDKKRLHSAFIIAKKVAA